MVFDVTLDSTGFGWFVRESRISIENYLVVYSTLTGRGNARPRYSLFYYNENLKVVYDEQEYR